MLFFLLFLVLLFYPIFLGVPLVGVSSVRADPTAVVSLNPMQITVPEPGQNFTVDLNITDISDLAAWTFMLAYNTTVLDAVYVSPSSDTQGCVAWAPIDGGVWHPDGPPTITENWTGGQGRIWTSASFPYGQEFTGNLTLVTINFTATATGNSTLEIIYTELIDPTATEIDHITLDGEVEVIPEFPATIALPLLLITTLAAVFLGKMVWSRKRKDALVAG